MQKRSEHRHDDEVIDRETIRAPMRRRNELYRDDPCGDNMIVQSASLVLWSNPGFLESRRQNVKPDVETGASGSGFFQRLRIAAIPTAPKVLIGGIWATVPTSEQMWSPCEPSLIYTLPPPGNEVPNLWLFQPSPSRDTLRILAHNQVVTLARINRQGCPKTPSTM